MKKNVYPFNESEIDKMIAAFNANIAKAKAKTEDNMKKAYQEKLFFILGINLGIRISDMRMLKWNFFFDDKHKWKEYYIIHHSNTNKCVKLFFNDDVKKVITEYTDKYPIMDYNENIFLNKNNGNITLQAVWNMLKRISKEANIDKNIGTHSLRKTWGYQCLSKAKDKNKTLVVLQYCFNHSSTQATLKYIGLKK